MEQSSHIEVYTDGQCPLCRWSRARVEPFDREGRIVWYDLNDPESLNRAAPHTFAELNTEMHVRRADGSWSKGFYGWLDVLRVLPRWRWLAGALSVWPFTRLGPVFYRWLAQRRYALFGVPPPCDLNGACALHKPKN
ncbi:MAG: DUF393 domain-containing protein [Pyrinomonadaceae bacterium]